MKPKTQPFVFQPLLIDLPTARAHCPQTFLAVIQWWFCPVYQSGAALMVSLGGEFHWTHVEVSNANVLIASATGPTGCWNRNKDQAQKCPFTCEGRHIASSWVWTTASEHVRSQWAQISFCGSWASFLLFSCRAGAATHESQHSLMGVEGSRNLEREILVNIITHHLPASSSTTGLVSGPTVCEVFAASFLLTLAPKAPQSHTLCQPCHTCQSERYFSYV